MIPTEMKSKFVDRSINDYLRIIVRRKWIILLFFLSTLLSTVYFVDKIEDIYESSSTIVIEEPTTYLKQQMMGNVRSLSFYEGILSSRSFLETVLDTIGLTRFQTVFPKMSREEAVQ
jgi:uncharacterized protein involved in exopolysaccharide biosynthesis